MLRPVLALASHNARIMLRDRAPLILIVVMPLVLMAFMKPLFGLALRAKGLPNANGAEQAVPGMGVMFLLFLVTFLGYAVFQEHAWRTWDRLRATSLHPATILLGKATPWFVLALLQQVILFTVGATVFGLHLRGSMVALAVTIFALGLCVLALSFAVAGICTTSQQIGAVSMLAAMVFAGIGGAVTPYALVPEWAKVLSPLTPTYWAVRGYRAAVLAGGTAGDAVKPVIVLLVMTAVFTFIALRYFRMDAQKIGWV